MEVKQNKTENIFSRSCWKKVCVFLLLVLLIIALALTISIILLTQLNNSSNNNSSLLSAEDTSENQVNNLNLKSISFRIVQMYYDCKNEIESMF